MTIGVAGRSAPVVRAAIPILDLPLPAPAPEGGERAVKVAVADLAPPAAFRRTLEHSSLGLHSPPATESPAATLDPGCASPRRAREPSVGIGDQIGANYGWPDRPAQGLWIALKRAGSWPAAQAL